MNVDRQAERAHFDSSLGVTLPVIDGMMSAHMRM